MDGNRIEIASKALELFIQSLPAGSYYQIIGFGSDYKVYDDNPKEYNMTNIKNSLDMIKKLGADLGGTNIAGPLKYIYDSDKIYEKINLPRSIILLTDGEAWDKEKGLNLIEQNSTNISEECVDKRSKRMILDHKKLRLNANYAMHEKEIKEIEFNLKQLREYEMV